VPAPGLLLRQAARPRLPLHLERWPSITSRQCSHGRRSRTRGRKHNSDPHRGLLLFCYFVESC
jgi:hypothetical protein